MKSPELDRKDRVALLFRAAQEQGLGVILLLEGTGLTGLVHTVDGLSSILDPRHFDVHHFPGFETAPERKDPFLYHYWLHLPRYGDLALFDGSYYHDWVSRRLFKKLNSQQLEDWIDDINRFEQSLGANQYLVLKIRVLRHKKDLQEELKEDKRMKARGPLVRKRAGFMVKEHKAYEKALQEAVDRTDFPHAPWFTPPESNGKEVRDLILDYLIARLEEALQVDSRSAVASYDEAMEKMRELQATGENE